jgi:hypothetical protein
MMLLGHGRRRGVSRVPVRPAGDLLAGAILIGAMLVGCSGADEPAPLGAAPSTPAGNCFVGDDDGALTRHVATFTPSESLDLEGVSISDSDNVELIDGFVLPFAGDPDVTGTFLRYPPGEGVIADSLMTWSERTRLGGARVEPADGQQAILVGIRLSDPRREGTLSGFTLTYSDAEGSESTRAYPGPMTLKPPSEPCTVEDFG